MCGSLVVYLSGGFCSFAAGLVAPPQVCEAADSSGSLDEEKCWQPQGLGCPALEAGKLGLQVDEPRKRRGLRTRVYGYGLSETIGYQALNRISLYIA